MCVFPYFDSFFILYFFMIGAMRGGGLSSLGVGLISVGVGISNVGVGLNIVGSDLVAWESPDIK